MPRWKLTVEYRGSHYRGWQRQEGQASVQQALEEAIIGFSGQEARVHAAGRTDAGVHALGQVAHFDLDYKQEMTGFAMVNALNAHLREHDVSVVAAEIVPEEFHARFSAVSKLYTYKILNRTAPPCLGRGLVWHVRRPLDVAVMQEGANYLLGHHDFTTFRASECQAKSPLRTLDVLTIERVGAEEIHIHAEARSFLHHQVRNMVGTLEKVGEGRWQPLDVKTALEARDRRKAAPTAPATGLYLVAVRY